MSKFDNQGYLYPSHGRRGEGSPHYTGKVTVGGVEYRLSAWKKTKGEVEMISLSVQTQEQYEESKAGRKPLPKDKDYEYQEPEHLPEHNNGLGQDEIPF